MIFRMIIGVVYLVVPIYLVLYVFLRIFPYSQYLHVLAMPISIG